MTDDDSSVEGPGATGGAGGERRGATSPVSVALVAAQLALIALLALPLETLWPDSVADLPAALLIVASVALALAAFGAMRASRFSVLPEPAVGGALIERGPYRFVRHPMYAAVLLGGAGAALLHGDARHWLALVALAAVLALKIRREERLLLAAYPGYADYRRRVRALLPGLL